MSDLENRRKAARDALVRQALAPAFVPNPKALAESRDPRWHQAAELGKKPLFRTEAEARAHVAKIADVADMKQDDHNKRRGR